MTRSSTKELFSPLDNTEHKFCSRRRLFDTPSLIESNSPKFDQISDSEEQSEEEEPNESLFHAWERFKELLMKCPQHYLTDMQEVILFYNGLDVPTRQILDLKGAIHSKTAVDAKVAFQEMVEFSQKWHNGISYLKGAIHSKTAVDAKVAFQEMVEFSQKWHNGISSLVYLGTSVSVMPFSTYTNLGLGILSHTRLTIELADRTIKQPGVIAKNMLVKIGKFVFLIDFIILDIPEDDDVPLILRQPFLLTAHSKIDVFKRKITLREPYGVSYGLGYGVLIPVQLFETYVKEKDLYLWHIILNGDFPPVAKTKVTQILEVVPFEQQDDETSTSERDDEEYVMAVRNFKKFFRRKGKFVRQLREKKKSFRQRDERKGKSDQKCFRCGDLNHLIGDYLKPSRNKDQNAFIRVSWSDSKNDAEDKSNDETCLMAQSSNEVCLRTCLEPDEWIKDSGCSKHMTGNKSLFSTYKAYNKGNVVFGSNLKGKIIGKEFFVSRLRKKYRLNLKNDMPPRDKNKPEDKIYLATIDENSTLWHRRLDHANMCLIQSLLSKELVRNLPKLKFDQHFCNACKIGKQAHASHRGNNTVSTTRCLELLHVYLFSPSSVWSYGGNRYTLVIVDDYCRNIEESLNVRFDETLPPSKTSPFVDNDLDEEEASKITKKKNLKNDIVDETLKIDEIVNIKETRNHRLENVIGNLNQRTLRSQAHNQSNFFCFISTIEPKNVNEALGDGSWIVAMQEELNQFIAN
nr:retrovirus-related Pol polyprotein from transposon TNT 1-94 [Tanacetum cinerariifolium]